MSSDRFLRRTALLGFLALAGCGFAPVYGNGGGPRGLFTYQTPDTVAGYRLRAQLEQRLGMPANPRYALAVTLSESSQPAAINATGDTTRYNVIGRANWALKDAVSGEEVDAGTVETFTSYAATGSTVATQAASEDATARLSVALADMITGRVLMLAPGLQR